MKSDMGLEGHGTENDAALGLLSDNTQVFKKKTNIELWFGVRVPVSTKGRIMYVQVNCS